ncbi:hypothetical protein ATANTOWER_005241, partial [Ataeniobius toweri]|nr:hypothetical protein [Ataeniobius toweri]
MLEVSGRRPRGRPKRRFLDVVKEDMKSEQPSPDSSSSSSGFAPTQHKRQVLGPLQSVVQDLQSDDNDDDSEDIDDNDIDSDAERPTQTRLTHQH